MIRWFKRRRPVHRAEPATSPDNYVAYAWGMDEVQWHSLTNFERQECRRNVTTAPRFMA